jgi:DNA-binding PadR family transcriptional regulator
MAHGDLLGHVEFAVLDAVHRGALRIRHSARQVPCLCEQPAGEALLHRALRRCEHEGLLRSSRDARGRSYELTAAGRSRLRAERRFRVALGRMLLGADRQLYRCRI